MISLHDDAVAFMDVQHPHEDAPIFCSSPPSMMYRFPSAVHPAKSWPCSADRMDLDRPPRPPPTTSLEVDSDEDEEDEDEDEEDEDEDWDDELSSCSPASSSTGGSNLLTPPASRSPSPTPFAGAPEIVLRPPTPEPEDEPFFTHPNPATAYERPCFDATRLSPLWTRSFLRPHTLPPPLPSPGTSTNNPGPVPRLAPIRLAPAPPRPWTPLPMLPGMDAWAPKEGRADDGASGWPDWSAASGGRMIQVAPIRAPAGAVLHRWA